MFFNKKYDEDSLVFQLSMSKPEYNGRTKGLAKAIKGGCIGKMTGLNEMLEKEIRDPNYKPKNGEVFGWWDGMFGTDEWFIMENNKMRFVE